MSQFTCLFFVCAVALLFQSCTSERVKRSPTLSELRALKSPHQIALSPNAMVLSFAKEKS